MISPCSMRMVYILVRHRYSTVIYRLRLEELKMAALVLHLKETQAHMDVVV